MCWNSVTLSLLKMLCLKLKCWLIICRNLCYVCVKSPRPGKAECCGSIRDTPLSFETVPFPSARCHEVSWHPSSCPVGALLFYTSSRLQLLSTRGSWRDCVWDDGLWCSSPLVLPVKDSGDCLDVGRARPRRVSEPFKGDCPILFVLDCRLFSCLLS